jgi:hypothetical protein
VLVHQDVNVLAMPVEQFTVEIAGVIARVVADLPASGKQHFLDLFDHGGHLLSRGSGSQAGRLGAGCCGSCGGHRFLDFHWNGIGITNRAVYGRDNKRLNFGKEMPDTH